MPWWVVCQYRCTHLLRYAEGAAAPQLQEFVLSNNSVHVSDYMGPVRMAGVVGIGGEVQPARFAHVAGINGPIRLSINGDTKSCNAYLDGWRETGS